MSTVKIFSGSGSIELAKKIASEFGKPLGKGKLGKFSDGELSSGTQRQLEVQMCILFSQL